MVRQPAIVLDRKGAVACQCTMRDVSATGAKLELAAPQEIPDEFTLVLSKHGTVRRECTVTWRSNTAIGVRFRINQPASAATTI